MSWTRVEQFQGKRSFMHDHYVQCSTPANRKYFTSIGDWLTPAHLAQFVLYGGGAVNGAGVYVDGTEVNEFLMNGIATSPTAVTPVKIINGKVRIRGRNNQPFIVDCTIHNIGPKDILPDINTSVAAGAFLHSSNMAMHAVIEGIGDKVNKNAIETEGCAILHTATVTVDTPVMRGTASEFFEMSLNPTLSPGLSEVYKNIFKTHKKFKMTLKPGDEFDITFNLPDQSFIDGIEVYTGSEFIGFPFTRFFWCELQGHLGFTGSTANTPIVPGIDSSAITNRLVGGKAHYNLNAAGVGYTKGFVDLAIVETAEMLVYTAELIEPLHSLSFQNTGMGSNDMTAANTQLEYVP